MISQRQLIQQATELRQYILYARRESEYHPDPMIRVISKAAAEAAQRQYKLIVELLRRLVIAER